MPVQSTRPVGAAAHSNPRLIDLAGEKILVADDERIFRESLVRMLVEAGYDVDSARDGEEALSKIRCRLPDLAVFDIMMPKLDGLAACASLRSAGCEVPVLFLTAKDSDADEIEALSMGADVFVSKTEAPEILLARIAAALRRGSMDGVSPDAFSFGSWRVEPGKASMTDGEGRRRSLSLRETGMLRLLASHPGEVFSKDFLAVRFFSGTGNCTDAAIGQALSRLKAKLGEDARLISTVYSQGVKFENGA